MRPLASVSPRTYVVDRRDDAERLVAEEIVELLGRNPGAVLGLATGNSPMGVYRELRAAHAAGRVSFARARTFNLDEYLDLQPGDPRSFRVWTEEQLLGTVRPRASHAPGVGPGVDPDVAAADYERDILQCGGLDLVLLGIGRNGHIAFNEPGSPRDSRTRVVDLHPTTRADAAATFGSLERVPRRAITMGIATILAARRIRVLAFGAGKAEVVRRTSCDQIGPAWPATYLREHPDVRLYVDREAGSALSPTARANGA